MSFEIYTPVHRNQVKTGQWWDRSWNPVTGCTPVSEACEHCYARTMHERFNKTPFSQVTPHPERLDAPLHWRQPRRVFVNSMSDLFHEQVPFEFIEKVFRSMWQAERHTYLILTKRAERMRDCVKRLMSPALNPEKMLGSIWLGVTAENQEMLDKRVPFLLQTPAAHRFLSLEPLLAQVLLPVSVCACGHSRGLHGDRPGDGGCRGARGTSTTLLCECRKLRGELRSAIDQVFVGPETGPMRRRRVCNEEWIRSIVDQCKEAGVACYIKAFPVTTATTSKPRSWISHDPSEWPSWARVRELR